MHNKSEGKIEKDKLETKKQNVDNKKLSRKNYTQSYNEVNKLIKDNNNDKTKDTLKHSFLVEWQKLEQDS